jgi:DNA-directed RNA polymerase subunit RPC12/RpoP
MPITVICYSCGKQLEAPNELVGKVAKCQNCGARLTVSRPEAGSSDPIRLPCPHCKTTVSVPRELVHRTVECAYCGKRFKVEAASPQQRSEPQADRLTEIQSAFTVSDSVVNASISPRVVASRWRPFPIVLGVVALILGFIMLNILFPSIVPNVVSVTKPEWHKAVLNFLNKNERLLSVDRVYKPESLNGAMILGSEGWCDALGEYSGTAFEPFGPGRGICVPICRYGVRAEYQIDEGFGRISKRDSVFFLTGDYKVTGYVPTERIRFDGVQSIDAPLKEVKNFFSNPHGQFDSAHQMRPPANQ